MRIPASMRACARTKRQHHAHDHDITTTRSLPHAPDAFCGGGCGAREARGGGRRGARMRRRGCSEEEEARRAVAPLHQAVLPRITATAVVARRQVATRQEGTREREHARADARRIPLRKRPRTTTTTASASASTASTAGLEQRCLGVQERLQDAREAVRCAKVFTPVPSEQQAPFAGERRAARVCSGRARGHDVRRGAREEGRRDGCGRCGASEEAGVQVAGAAVQQLAVASRQACHVSFQRRQARRCCRCVAGAAGSGGDAGAQSTKT
jgi:hypothetical protein